jgi:hypothetical protein
LKETVHEISNKTSRETSFNETSSNEGLSEWVSESRASLGSARTDASHLPQEEPTEEVRQWSYDEIYVVQSLMTELFNREANQAVLARIQAGDPKFVWTLESKAVVLQVLSSGRWSKSIKTPDDFAWRWESGGPTSLGSQVWRNMPDQTPVQALNEIPDSYPDETRKECEARTQVNTIYNGTAVAVITNLYKESTPQLQKYSNQELWLYKDEGTGKWLISWNRADLLKKLHGVEPTYTVPKSCAGLGGRFGAAMAAFEMQEEEV